MPVPPGAKRGEMGKFSFQSYLIFMSFYIYHFFCIPEYLTLTYLLCTYVGPVHPVDFSRTRRHPRPLRRIERNLTTLTRTVPMVEIEDLPPSMQPHVVEVPWTWVHLFRHLANVVVHYVRANMPCP
jgi:hypothetical protein